MTATPNEIAKCHDVRSIALRLAYSIPGYEESPLATKNALYDEIIRQMNKIPWKA